MVALAKIVTSAIILCFYSILSVKSEASQDPCQTAKIIPDSEYRGTQCLKQPGKAICDRYLNVDTWYRAHDDNLLIATSPVNHSMCATRFPIWINGTLPSVEEGEVSLTACMSHLSVCSVQYQVQAINCKNEYYVYRFPNLPSSCDAAFCFGNNVSCPPVDPCHWFYNDEFQDVVDGPTCHSGCDKTRSSGWYVFGKRSTPRVILNQCPSNQRCTNLRMWFNYSSSMNINQTDSIMACASSQMSCCEKEYQISVMRCPEFFVYKLSPSQYCMEHICVEGSKMCSAEEVTTGSGATMHTSPTRKDISASQDGLKATDIGLIVGVSVAVVAAISVGTYVIVKKMNTTRNTKRVGSELQKYF